MLHPATALFAVLAWGPAAEAPVDVRWDAPEGCPAQDEVQAKVAALLQKAPASTEYGKVTAIARVRKTETEAWDLKLWLVTEDGTRERSLQDEDCAALADAAALVLAIAIAPELLAELDPDAVEEEPPPPPPAPTAPPTPPPEEPPPREPPPAPPRRDRPEVHGGVRVDAGVSAGALPNAGAVLSLAPALLLRRARVEVFGRYGFRRRVRFDDAPASGADFRHWAVGARGCPVFRARVPLEFPICGGFELGQILARDVNLVGGRSAQRLWAAVDLSAALVYVPIRQLALSLSVEGFVPFVRPRFTVDGGGELLHRPWPAGVRAMFGPEVRFP